MMMASTPSLNASRRFLPTVSVPLFASLVAAAPREPDPLPAPPPYRDDAGAHDFEHADRLQQLEQRLELVGGADHTQHQGAAIDIDDLGLEDLGDLQHVVALFAFGGDLDQHELGGHRVLRLKVADLDDVDQLVELLGDLVDGVLGAVDHDRHAREVRVFALADGEALDVEAPAGEQAGHPGQHAGFVLDEHRQGVLHGFAPFVLRDALPPISSVIDWPAGTIGNTFSSGEILKSITVGRPLSMAARSASPTCSGSVTRRPLAPNASASMTKSGCTAMQVCE